MFVVSVYPQVASEPYTGSATEFLSIYVNCVECKDSYRRGTSQGCPLTSTQFTSKAEEDDDPGFQPQPKMHLKINHKGKRRERRGGGGGRRG